MYRQLNAGQEGGVLPARKSLWTVDFMSGFWSKNVVSSGEKAAYPDETALNDFPSGEMPVWPYETALKLSFPDFG